MAFSNLAVIWMFAGRNNVFLWLTGWKYSTFSIFHRHVARIATLEAIVHSISYTVLKYRGEFTCCLVSVLTYADRCSEGDLYYSWTLPYWYTGAIVSNLKQLRLHY